MTLIRKRLRRMERKIDHLLTEVEAMAIDQETFDTDLAELVTAIGTLTQAVDAALATRPTTDLTAEDQSVKDAAQAVSDELAKINPAPAPTPEPTPTPEPGTTPGQ